MADRTIRIMIRNHKKALQIIKERGESEHRIERLGVATIALNGMGVVYDEATDEYVDIHTLEAIDYAD